MASNKERLDHLLLQVAQSSSESFRLNRRFQGL